MIEVVFFLLNMEWNVFLIGVLVIFGVLASFQFYFKTVHDLFDSQC